MPGSCLPGVRPRMPTGEQTESQRDDHNGLEDRQKPGTLAMAMLLVHQGVDHAL